MSFFEKITVFIEFLFFKLTSLAAKTLVPLQEAAVNLTGKTMISSEGRVLVFQRRWCVCSNPAGFNSVKIQWKVHFDLTERRVQPFNVFITVGVDADADGSWLIC